MSGHNNWPFETDPEIMEQDKYKCTCYVPKNAKIHPHWCKSKQKVTSKIDIVLKKIQELQKVKEEK